MVKYISYQFDNDNTNAEDKILEFLDSTSIIENVLSDNPTPPDSANIREILFTLDSTFLKYESRDKLGNMINMEYIPARARVIQSTSKKTLTKYWKVVR